MNKEALFDSIENHFKAIDLCIENHCRMPALILIYAGVDIFASLSRPDNKDKATRQDYIDWCEKYISPKSNLSCTGLDLYAARCGIVHTYTMESQLSEEGKARELIYAWGDRKPEDLQAVLDKVEFTQRVIHIETLSRSFREGVADFLSELENDNARAAMVIRRAGKLFKDQPDEFWR